MQIYKFKNENKERVVEKIQNRLYRKKQLVEKISLIKTPKYIYHIRTYMYVHAADVLLVYC